MAKRPERASQKTLPSTNSAIPSEARESPATTETAQSAPVEFRAFDPSRVDQEFVGTEAKVQTAVADFESAKTVSARALEARVCL